jgi:Fe-S-cluster containining protein
MIQPLSRPYLCRDGAPLIERIDTEMFFGTYFGHCMACTYCHDSCCQYGADAELKRVEALLARADDLERYLGVPRGRWFREIMIDEPEYPGGKYTRTNVIGEDQFPAAKYPRTAVIDEACVFLNRDGRGCRIHAYCLERGIDVHDLKPMVCLLFPLSFADGLLMPAAEIREETLACLGPGPTVYRSARADVLHYFGPELVAELDATEAACLAANPRRSEKTIPLPMAAG